MHHHQRFNQWQETYASTLNLGQSLLWRHNGQDSVSNHQPHHCLLSRLFGHRSKKTSKLRVTGLCAWNSPGTGEFPAQMASNAENVSIWWRHHGTYIWNEATFQSVSCFIFSPWHRSYFNKCRLVCVLRGGDTDRTVKKTGRVVWLTLDAMNGGQVCQGLVTLMNCHAHKQELSTKCLYKSQEN